MRLHRVAAYCLTIVLYGRRNYLTALLQIIVMQYSAWQIGVEQVSLSKMRVGFEMVIYFVYGNCDFWSTF